MEEVFKIMGFVHQTKESIEKEGDQSALLIPGLFHEDFYNHEDAKKHLDSMAPEYESENNGLIHYFRIEKFYRLKNETNK